MGTNFIVGKYHPFLKEGIKLTKGDSNIYYCAYFGRRGIRMNRQFFSKCDVMQWYDDGWLITVNSGFTYKYTYSMDQIANAICKSIGISFLDLRAENRDQNKSVLPRQLFCYYTRKLIPTYSNVDLANYLRPNKPFNHATIIHSINKIENKIKKKHSNILKYINDIDNKLKI